MKVFALAPREDWICDRFCQEWLAESGMGTRDPYQADVIWALADWCWDQLPLDLIQKKPVVVTVHHIVPEKFGKKELAQFQERDKHVTAYHVPCRKTFWQVHSILVPLQINKPIFCHPFWVNDQLWHPTNTPKIRKELQVDGEFVIGSFQRDTEGHDLVSPKLEKGPDLFCDAVIKLHQISQGLLLPPVRVLLAGWRRQYVISKLEEAGVRWTYEERPSLERVNELYNALDTYIVSSRHEGGPQAILECAAIGIPVVSRDVGVAAEILHPDCVDDDLVNMIMKYSATEESRKERLDYATEKVKKLFWNFDPFVQFFESVEKRSAFSRISPGIGNRSGDV